MPYRTQSPDTSREFEKVQFDLLRQAGATRRLQLARAHTHSAMRQAYGRIARQHPGWSEQEVKLHWAELMYGKELTEQVRAYLQKQNFKKAEDAR